MKKNIFILFFFLMSCVSNSEVTSTVEDTLITTKNETITSSTLVNNDLIICKNWTDITDSNLKALNSLNDYFKTLYQDYSFSEGNKINFEEIDELAQQLGLIRQTQSEIEKLPEYKTVNSLVIEISREWRKNLLSLKEAVLSNDTETIYVFPNLLSSQRKNLLDANYYFSNLVLCYSSTVNSITTTSSTTTTTSSTTTTIPKTYEPGEFNEETKAWIPDPSFTPINLYDKTGKVITVNSQNEMEDYISKGWSKTSVTISTTTTTIPFSDCPEQINSLYTLPKLCSFSLSVPSSPKAGDTITFNYQISAGSATFNYMSICLKNKTLQKDQCISISRPSLTGPYYYAIPTDWPDGEYGIERVFLNDSSGGNVEYYNNGQAYKNPQNALGGATSHQLFNANTLFTK